MSVLTIGEKGFVVVVNVIVMVLIVITGGLGLVKKEKSLEIIFLQGCFSSRGI